MSSRPRLAVAPIPHPHTRRTYGYVLPARTKSLESGHRFPDVPIRSVRLPGSTGPSSGRQKCCPQEMLARRPEDRVVSAPCHVFIVASVST